MAQVRKAPVVEEGGGAAAAAASRHGSSAVSLRYSYLMQTSKGFGSLSGRVCSAKATQLLQAAWDGQPGEETAGDAEKHTGRRGGVEL